MTAYMIHGTTDEVTTCACCGKKNLRNTVVLEVVEGDNAGDLLHFGSMCAARAMGQKMSRADVVLAHAKRAQKIQPVVSFIKSNIHRGIDAIKEEARAFAKANKIDALVNGFDSWGEMNVHANGITIRITA